MIARGELDAGLTGVGSIEVIGASGIVWMVSTMAPIELEN